MLIYSAVLVALLSGLDSIPETSRAEPTQAAAPILIVHRQPALPVVALRLSLLADDPPGYAGAGHMMQHLLYPSLQEQLRRVGGRIELERTSDAVVYTVTGPASELSYLARVLTGTLDPPEVAQDAVLRADREMREERLAEWEEAQSHARSVLRAQLFPGDISVAGTDRSATRFSSSSMQGIWRRMYSPDRVSIIAVGDVYLADLQREFASLPAARAVAAPQIQRDSVLLTSLAPAEATQAWVGAAFPVTDLPPAAVNVTVRMLENMLRRKLPTVQVEGEHWWTHHGQAAVLLVSPPDRDLAAARRALGTAAADLLREISFLSVVETAATIRREMLFYSRTPDRMANLVGQFIDRGGDPSAPERFYSEVDSVDDKDVRAILERLVERTPARVDIPAQVLPRRQ